MIRAPPQPLILIALLLHPTPVHENVSSLPSLLLCPLLPHAMLQHALAQLSLKVHYLLQQQLGQQTEASGESNREMNRERDRQACFYHLCMLYAFCLAAFLTPAPDTSS